MKSTLKSNSVLIGFYVFYLIILAFIFKESFSIILVLHGIGIFIALTPIGEEIMRLINHTKKIQRKEDKEYLLPLFEEVYEQARIKNEKLSKNITLFMSDDIVPNAFACASNTVCVTKGAMNTFSREELQGILAHELGHISNNDTKVSMVFLIGNCLLIGFAMIFNFIFWCAGIVVSILGGNNLILRFVKWFKKVISEIGSMIISAIFALNSRVCERGADKFAHDIGYGLELKSALVILKTLDTSGDMTLMERIYASHPDIDVRISLLEDLENLEETE